MGDDFHGIDELYNFYERIVPPGIENQGSELRSISARIPAGSYDYLGELAERWSLSKSGLAALLLQAALNEIDLREEREKQNAQRLKAQGTVL